MQIGLDHEQLEEGQVRDEQRPDQQQGPRAPSSARWSPRHHQAAANPTSTSENASPRYATGIPSSSRVLATRRPCRSRGSGRRPPTPPSARTSRQVAGDHARRPAATSSSGRPSRPRGCPAPGAVTAPRCRRPRGRRRRGRRRRARLRELRLDQRRPVRRALEADVLRPVEEDRRRRADPELGRLRLVRVERGRRLGRVEAGVEGGAVQPGGLRDRDDPLAPEPAPVLAVLVRIDPVAVVPVLVLLVGAVRADRRQPRLVAATAQDVDLVVDDPELARQHELVDERRAPRPASAGRRPGTGSRPRPPSPPAPTCCRARCASWIAAGYSMPGSLNVPVARAPSWLIASDRDQQHAQRDRPEREVAGRDERRPARTTPRRGRVAGPARRRTASCAPRHGARGGSGAGSDDLLLKDPSGGYWSAPGIVPERHDSCREAIRPVRPCPSGAAT